MQNKKLIQDMVDKISQLAQCAAELGLDTTIIMMGVKQANFDLVLDRYNDIQAEEENAIRECVETIRGVSLHGVNYEG